MLNPLPRTLAAFLYAELLDACSDNAITPAARALRTQEILADALYQATVDEPQLFSDLYSRLLYVADKYSLPAYLTRELHAMRRHLQSRRAGADIEETTLLSCCKAVALTISHLSNAGVPEALQQRTQGSPPLASQTPTVATADDIPFVRLRAVGIVPENADSNHTHKSTHKLARAIDCITEDGEPLRLGLLEPWHTLAAIVWERATIHCFQLRRATSKASPELALAVTTSESFVVLEPDYLVDVTDAAECFQGTAQEHEDGWNPLLSLLKKFTRSDVKESLVFGSIINSCFDALIANPDAAFEETFQAALMQKPTALMPLVAENEAVEEHLRVRARPQFDTMRATLVKLGLAAALDTATTEIATLDTVTLDTEQPNAALNTALNTALNVVPSVEPSFMSPEYGLQGRLDVMLEYADDSRRKTVVELKSSKPPEAASQRAWANNAAQVTCYNLLLDASFGEHGEARSGDSMIFYSRDDRTPLRNIPNDLTSKQRVVRLRNELIAMEHHLCNRNFSLLRRINARDFGSTPSYVAPDRDLFETIYKAATATERRYFHVFASFVARENWSARLGDGTLKNGFSALWRASLAEKEATFSILSHLRLDKEQSDFERMYVRFERTERTPALANFRVGDVVIVYSVSGTSDETSRHAHTKSALLKGAIRELSDEHILVTLRNKRQSTSFDGGVAWCIEQDFFGSEFTAQYQSLYDVLRAPKHKRDLLLGLREPRFREDFSTIHSEIHADNTFADLTDEQRTRLAEAASAQDYYLLQGPPGTGKTSRMIRSMAQYLHERTNEHIVLLAFTNRAVDEMCDALKKAGLPFVRLGSKDASAHKESILIEQIQGKSLGEAYTFLSSARILVSTISSMLKTPELLAMKETAGTPITTAIIDEASQVVEPQIVGLMARFERTILVGDEKQLPAVVTQPEQGLTTSAEDLNALGIKDLRVSLFERLLRRAAEQGWTRAFGIISRQGRMHSAIQEFPNKQFYGGKLQPLNEWQSSTTLLAELHCTERLVIPAVRVAFVGTHPESRSKVHAQEAQLAARIVRELYEHAYDRGEPFTPESVGVITPFRAQIAAITNELNALFPRDRNLLKRVTVDTVERYQGSERDVIVLSLAVSHASQLRSIQSLSPDGAVDRKLNVALTRARQRLIVLGCPAVLESVDAGSEYTRHLRAFIAHVRERGGFVATEM